MSETCFDADYTPKVTVPIRRVGDRWEFFYGGDVPVKDGTIGELTINIHQIDEDDFRERVTAEHTFKVLEENTPLLVAISSRLDSSPYAGLDEKFFPQGVPPGTTCWKQVRLGPQKPKFEKKGKEQIELTPEPGGLWLKLKGLEKCELNSSTILMPKGFHQPKALSLNHALTMLSKEYEKHRISNTGNVYCKIFYQDKDECWYPLNDLRQGLKVKAERELLVDLWKQIESKLGWRPVQAIKKPKR